MSDARPTEQPRETGWDAAQFPATHWSLLSQARVPEADSAARQAALNRLAQLYWRPIYAYLRLRWSRPPADAMDLTQEFFLHVLEGGFLAAADRERGRFRALLKTSLDHFVVSFARKEDAQIRGGGRQKLSIDFGDEPDRILITREGDSPEEILDRHWRRAVLEEGLRRLEERSRAQGKEALFQVFQRYDLAADGLDRPRYEDLGRELGLSRDEIDYHLRSARRKLLEAIREVLAESVREASDLATEERHFFEAASW